MVKKMAFLGPRGSFSEEAAWHYCQDHQVELVPVARIRDIFQAVESGQVDQGIVPLENSYEGSVNITIDLLAHDFDVKICGEINLPVIQNLIVKPGTTRQSVKKIFSHPQALAQAMRYLEENFPGVELVETTSTSEAVVQVANSKDTWAAVGPARAARYYGLEILQENINSCLDNITRFVIIGQQENLSGRGNKTSLIVTTKDKPGELYQVLKIFSLKNINLTKIESRPTRKKLGEYFFFIDVEGNRFEFPLRDALTELEKRVSSLKILGVYPGCQGVAETPQKAEDGITSIRKYIDVIDHELVDLLVRRSILVQEIGKLKKNRDNVQDNKREQEILARLTDPAVCQNLDPDFIRNIFTMMFDYFVKQQKRQGFHINQTNLVHAK